MAKKNNVRPVSYPSEFDSWLKAQNVKKKERRNPEALQRYYQEWAKMHARKPKKRSLFKLPALDLDQIASHARKVSELVETIQGVKNMMNQPKTHDD
ncbi:hypothetical protein LOK74_00985 [Brevibacillus humidisoli]|uniref:hypothetical protein n=1 Tax=Brevibacillus humidisoli TaxID=2895522 RepID=UPI001E4BEB36|nr:hypothetical protein [Brevibacillus humidisoli]UFJ41167.1 hypothetical protein LOK74_00985 [Brevibacillus humidisoli]